MKRLLRYVALFGFLVRRLGNVPLAGSVVIMGCCVRIGLLFVFLTTVIGLFNVSLSIYSLPQSK